MIALPQASEENEDPASSPGKSRLNSTPQMMQVDILEEDVSRKARKRPQTESGFKGQTGTPDPFVLISIALPRHLSACGNQIQDPLTLAPDLLWVPAAEWTEPRDKLAGSPSARPPSLLPSSWERKAICIVF